MKADTLLGLCVLGLAICCALLYAIQIWAVLS